MNSSWIRAQDRRRSLAAALSTACLYAFAFLGALIIGSLMPAHLASVPGTVIVDLGSSDGPAGEVPLGLPNAPERPAGAPPGAAPLPGAASQPDAAPAPEPAVPSKVAAIPAPQPASKAAPKAAPKAAVPAPKPAPKTAAKAALPAAKTIPDKDTAALAAAAQAAAQADAAQAAAAEASAAALAAERAAPPKTRTFGSGSSSAPVSSPGSGSAPGVAGGTGSVTFRGSEMGSALSTTFGASTGLVGRNLYEPIWMYMPLPKTVKDSVYQKILAKVTFGSFYQQSGSDWKLKAQIPVAQRSEVWNMLDSAGFDASTADFRTERKLSPVVLEFAVGPLTKGRVELVDVRLVSSSGSSEIDEAVIYGFRRGAYFNKTGNAVGGRFVYGF